MFNAKVQCFKLIAVEFINKSKANKIGYDPKKSYLKYGLDRQMTKQDKSA